MTRLVTYTDIVRQRIRWNKSLKNARHLHGDELLDYALNTGIEYMKLIDDYRRFPQDSVLDHVAEQLMQLQAIQDILEQRQAKK